VSTVEQWIDVKVPVRTAYNQWTQFEEFPRFMESVTNIRQLDDTTVEWEADIAGRTKRWTARITEQVPDEKVAWQALDGSNAGVVTFHRIGENETRVTAQMDIEPESAVERIGDAIGAPDRQVKGDLERFKEYIEGRGRETGAWRGEVEQTKTG
jgi:uncharacterized membrane protein